MNIFEKRRLKKQMKKQIQEQALDEFLKERIDYLYKSGILDNLEVIKINVTQITAGNIVR